MPVGLRTLLVLAMILLALTGGADPAVAQAVPEAPAPDPAPMTLEQALEQVASYRTGDSRAGLLVVIEHVRRAQADPTLRPALAEPLVALLRAEKTSLDARRFLCRQLALVGHEASVPALAALLHDEALSHMARYALERIPGPAAGQALLEAAGQLEGLLRIGVINSLGERQETSAVSVLSDLLEAPDAEAATAAAEALGKIGGQSALQALARARDRFNERLRFVVGTQQLKCADRLAAAGQLEPALAVYHALYQPGTPLPLCQAAFVGLATHGPDRLERVLEALRTGHPSLAGVASDLLRRGFAGPEMTGRLIPLVRTLSPFRRALLIRVLADRGDPRARPVLRAAARDSDPRVRLAAYHGLGTLGDATDVACLTEAAAKHDRKTEPGKAARRSLDILVDPAVDAALIRALASAKPAEKIVLIQAMEARQTPGAVPTLLEAATGADAKVRRAALDALGELAGESDLPRFTRLVAAAPKSDQKTAWTALATACRRIEDPDARWRPILDAWKTADVPGRCSLLRVAARVRGDPALAVVRTELESTDAAVKDAAVRALSEWTDPAPLEDLLRIARTSEDNGHQVLALRGFARLLREKSRRSSEKTLALYREGLAAAPRPEEKKLLISGLGRLGSLAALEVVRPCLEETALAREAEAAVLRLAETVSRTKDAKSRAALLTFLDRTVPRLPDQESRNKAAKIIQRLNHAMAREL